MSGSDSPAPIGADASFPFPLQARGAFAGYAAMFDRVDRAGDVFRRGAFAGAVRVPLLRNHHGSPVGEATVREDDVGLVVEGVAEGVRVGDGLSVGYRALDVRQGARREILRVRLVEVSLVAVPMQPGARVMRVDAPSDPLRGPPPP